MPKSDCGARTSLTSERIRFQNSDLRLSSSSGMTFDLTPSRSARKTIVFGLSKRAKPAVGDQTYGVQSVRWRRIPMRTLFLQRTALKKVENGLTE